ncbi:TPA: hypothetical protein U1D13_002290 [Streptococcus suis]|nr:hypothetical protein [Streptococcus suis]HEM3627643.1 hypothetical protein [Streptococcus suis]HEM3640785.1 hypothetical protein [Streptococcus suis]HEM3653812.1 hypothetical protein [Streptococcus suis]HEM3716193.1 hypothetical protein [Streptococcus suis]
MKFRLIKLSILLVAISAILAGCGKKLDGTYNSYGSASAFSSSDTLTTIKIENNTVTMSIQYYELDGLLTTQLSEKKFSLSGKINKKDKTITVSSDEKGEFTFNYEIAEGNLILDGEKFVSNTSKNFTKNQNDYREAQKKLEKEIEENSEISEDASISSTNTNENPTSSSLPNDTQTKKISEKITKDLNSQIIGKWTSGHFDTPWKDGSKLEFKEDGTFTITEIMPNPDYLAYDITFSGTYQFDIEKLTSKLMEESTSSFGTPLDLNKINTYQDYVGQRNNLSSSLPMVLNYTKTGQNSEGIINETATTTIEISYKNNSIELSTTNFFYKFTSYPQYTKE